MSAELFSAVASGNTERVRMLLASDPCAANAKDGDGATPLHYATLRGGKVWQTRTNPSPRTIRTT